MFVRNTIHLSLIFIFTLLLPATGPTEEPVQSKMIIYALRFGVDSLFPKKQIYPHVVTGEKVPLSWIAYLIIIDNKKILIDTGFNDPVYKKLYEIPQIFAMTDLLKSLNLTPDDITDVILTHTHVDHAGNIGLFKKANFFFHPHEYNFIKKIPLLNKSLKQLKKSQITFFNNYLKLTPSITIKHVGGHTKGSSMIEINGVKQRFLFTGDNCYFVEDCPEKNFGGTILTHHDPLILNGAKQTHTNIFLIHHE